jgi:hypothetical protein
LKYHGLSYVAYLTSKPVVLTPHDATSPTSHIKAMSLHCSLASSVDDWSRPFAAPLVYNHAATASTAAAPAPITPKVACGAPPVAEDTALLAADLADDSTLEIALLKSDPVAVDVWLEMLEATEDAIEDRLARSLVSLPRVDLSLAAVDVSEPALWTALVMTELTSLMMELTGSEVVAWP